MPMSPELCRGARALLGWSQQELAMRAQVARKTIADFELRQITPQRRTLRDVIAALEAAGIEFLPATENVSRGGLRIKWGSAQSQEQAA
jgi:transcriptional regulator with XRE-family HTH domain